jgi:hypothetical protein
MKCSDLLKLTSLNLRCIEAFLRRLHAIANPASGPSQSLCNAGAGEHSRQVIPSVRLHR